MEAPIDDQSALEPARALAPSEADQGDERCLPVVSKECGCVYPCALGTPSTREGGYQVRAALWETALEGRVELWCAEGQCTPAFHVELVCDGICAPRPADTTCALRGGRCMSAQPAAVVDGAYRVFWDREGSAAGTLSLEEGRYVWSGAPPKVGGRSFHFVDHPDGRYAVQMEVNAEGKRPMDLPDGARVALINFDPEGVSFESSDARALVEVRVDAGRRALYFHSVVSELEGWKIERSWEAK
jgi:hypothetical protein